jgi:primary-amine oxidase
MQIVAISLALRRYTAEKTDIKAIRFITTCLLPPPKRDVLSHLGIPLETGREPGSAPTIVRKSEVDVRVYFFWLKHGIHIKTP